MNPRLRRLRASGAWRGMLAEHNLRPRDFVQPFFVMEGKGKREAVPSMPGIGRFSVDLLLREVEAYIRQGGMAGLFFGVVKNKDLSGRQAVADNGVVPQAVKTIKRHFPEFLCMTDVCLCGYLSHGHCGIVKDGHVDNDATLPLLARMALAHAAAGADVVAPSDMMDHRVAAIREALDKQGYTGTAILAYAVKYASAYYGPFRDAAGSAPSFGDRRTYQMDPANSREALREAVQDVAEGADMVMVKPALAYLDVVAMLRRELTVPVAAYNVSGEYSMVKAAAERNWIDEKAVVLETMLGLKRAGADIIISYHARDVLGWLK